MTTRAAPLRVLVNLAYLRPGKVGGSEIYCRELCRALSRRTDVALRLLLHRTAGDAIPEVAERVVEGSGEWSQLQRLRLENGALRREARGADVVFSPANFAPVLPPGRPQVAAIHDLQHVWFPQHFSRRKWLEREALFRWTSRNAHLIAISDFTRRDVERRYGGRVTTVLEGVDLQHRPSNATVSAIRAEHGRFFYYPATDNAHKDHETALRALARLRNTDVRLVLTGSKSDRWPALEALSQSLGISHRVQHLGFVSHERVFELLAGSVGLVFPSRFEGFGLPLLEAMHCGAPVVASAAASIPEVAGDAAVLVSPGDSAAFAAAMDRFVEDPAFVAEQVARGRQNLERFSWDRCAAETLAVFQAACA